MEMIEEIDWDGNIVAVRTKDEVKKNVLVYSRALAWYLGLWDWW